MLDPDRIPILGDICNQNAPGLAGANAVAITQYGESVYVAGYDDNAIVRFFREHHMP